MKEPSITDIHVNYITIPKAREGLYFQIMRKGKGKNRLKNIIIPTCSTFCDLDRGVRFAYSYDSLNHSSAFHEGPTCRSKKIAQLNPDGSGENGNKKVSAIFTTKDTSLTYIYDLAEGIRHEVTYNGIVDSEPDTIEICT